MAGDKHDKTEAPTPKRKKENRKEGRVVRSEDLVTWMSIIVATSVLPGLVSNAGSAIHDVLISMVEVAHNPDERVLPGLVGKGLIAALTAIVPAMLALAAFAVVANVAQVGLLLTGKPLKPKMSRLNPIAGLKRMFSVKSLWATVTSSLKLGIIVTIAAVLVRGSANDMMSAPLKSAPDAVHDTAMLGLQLVRMIAFAALLVGAADYAFQRRQMIKETRMSKHEIKQEHRESDGDPHVKHRQRQVRHEMSRNRMLADVANADVLITNPTHFAIAIRYERSKGAPRVIARGADVIAAAIRSAAAEAGVPCVEAKPLARALYTVCRVGEEIPPELYQGVATVLAFLQRLGAAQRRSGTRVGLDVPDTWTPSSGALERITPSRRRVLARIGDAEPIAHSSSA